MSHHSMHLHNLHYLLLLYNNMYFYYLNMYKKMKKTTQSLWIAGTAVAVVLLTNLCSIRFSTVYIIFIAGCVGVALYWMKQRGSEGKNEVGR